jgi:hypothetical protein
VVSYVVLCKKSVKMNLVSESERERERLLLVWLDSRRERRWQARRRLEMGELN